MMSLLQPAAEARWTALVDGVLRKARRIGADAPAGAGVAELVRTSPDGIRVRPLYTRPDREPATGVPGAAPFVRGATPAGASPGGWDVRQRHADPDRHAAREAILTDLENGVTSIWLAVGEGGTAVADLAHVLEEIHLDLAPVVLDASTDQVPVAEEYLRIAGDRGVDPTALLGTLGLDPIGRRARTGHGPSVDSVVPLATRVAREFPTVRAVVADGLPVHSAGGSDAQELGYLTAVGLAYLRVLTAAGLDVAPASGLLEFRLAATASQFPTIAKLRAQRQLWSRVTEVCGQACAPAQHAVTSPTMLTRRDPWVNLLRGTLAGFGAGLGGAAAVTVSPFDAALGAPEAFSRRIARNTQALLIEESHLARVIDPAGGSWFVEALTAELAAAAWSFFQEIEAAGGAVAALDSGLVDRAVGTVRAKRERDVATRKVTLTGVSEFADLDEESFVRRDVPVPAGGGLPVYRPAQAFETMRDRSDAVLASAGRRPRVFLATLGPLASYTARAGFTRNLLQAGGIDVGEAGPTAGTDDVVDAYASQGGGPVVVLCSTDELYAERGAETVAGLRAAGAITVLVAGRVDVDGADGTLFAGCDALATIDSAYSNLGVSV